MTLLAWLIRERGNLFVVIAWRSAGAMPHLLEKHLTEPRS